VGEAIRWDGKPETLELLREQMPDCLAGDLNGLYVKTLRPVSEKGYVHGERLVPLGWYVTPRTCPAHRQRYADVKAEAR
jgi:hypothetical protein